MEPYNENESGLRETLQGQVSGVPSEKEGEINSEFTSLNAACSKLAENIEKLEERLKPILRILPPEPKSSERQEEKMGTGLNTEIGRILKEQRTIIDYQIDKTEEIIKRIEL